MEHVLFLTGQPAGISRCDWLKVFVYTLQCRQQSTVCIVIIFANNIIMEWTDEKVFQLIKLYESQPCLYDMSCKEYHNRDIKKQTLDKIALELHTTGQFGMITVFGDSI